MHPHRIPAVLLVTLFLLLTALVGPSAAPALTPLYAQEEPPAEPADELAEPPGYRDFIPEDANTETGVFTLHEVYGRWYFELPADIFGKAMLWHAEVDAAPFLGSLQPDVPYFDPSLGDHVITWENLGDRVVIRDQTGPLTLRATPPEPPEPGAPETVPLPGAADLSVSFSALPAVLAVFPVLVTNDNGDPVIDVTDYFAADLPEFSVQTALSYAGVQADSSDPERSLIAAMRAFPENVLVRSLLTFPLEMMDTSVASVQVAHSFTLLPAEPMQPRYADPRIGYFTTDYALMDENDRPGLQPQALITRYRLEKADPTAAVSEPLTPITFYLAPEAPEKWRSAIKQGVEDWQAAFEGAGFRNAIIAVDAPTPEEDPTWDAADSRHSVIRWVAQPVENAFGPNIYDPRTGEVLAGRVYLNDDLLKWLERAYVTQTGAVDPQAKSLPLPDALMGEILRAVVTHEVGHVLGLSHNHKASQAYTTEQLRNPQFIAANGHVASIMSYGRYNYVAQPEDGVTELIPKIGPYDRFAIRWGYEPIAAPTPAAERATLNDLLSAQRENPWLLFGGEDWAAESDPTVLTENIGADRIETAQLGIANLHRILDALVTTAVEDDQETSLLGDLYYQVLENRELWLLAVIKELGGVVETRTLQADALPFVRVPVERQRQALDFVLQNLQMGQEFVRPDIAARLAPTDQAAWVLDGDKRLLAALLAGSRYLLLDDAALMEPAAAYPLAEYLDTIQRGLFADLYTAAPSPTPFVRALQRSYLSRVKQQLLLLNIPYTADQVDAWEAAFDGWGLGDYLANSLPDTALRAAAGTALRELDTRLERAQSVLVDAETRAHYADLREEIAAALTR